jgi:hypothetical protein
MRALRPDRMLYALSLFAEEKLGRKYVENRTIECKILKILRKKIKYFLIFSCSFV